MFLNQHFLSFVETIFLSSNHTPYPKPSLLLKANDWWKIILLKLNPKPVIRSVDRNAVPALKKHADPGKHPWEDHES